jgi:hypothetical protein
VGNAGQHDVIAHGTTGGYVVINGERTNAGQLVDAIRANPSYVDGQACRLIVCHSGASGVAQQIADELGVFVRAPTNKVGTFRAGGPGQEPQIFGEGEWVWKRPGD